MFLSDLCLEVTLCKVDFFAKEVVQVEQLSKQAGATVGGGGGGINENKRINRNKTFQAEVIPQKWWCFLDARW